MKRRYQYPELEIEEMKIDIICASPTLEDQGEEGYPGEYGGDL